MLEATEVEERLRLYLWYRAMMEAAVQRGQRSLAGCLLLLAGAEQALAGRIAGGAVLLMLAGAAQSRAALRAGQCDFLVNDLDEAVRILKQEVRRGAAVSVCLQRSPAQVRQAAIVRGLQPDLLDVPEPVLQARGARLLLADNALQPGEHLTCWSASTDGRRERLAAACLPHEDWERQRWLLQTLQMPGRHRPRVCSVPLLQSEAECLREKLTHAHEPCTLWTPGA